MAQSLPAALLIILLIQVVGGEFECPRDGLFVDYSSGCQQYYRCMGGRARARYTCGAGRMFSAALGACVPAAGGVCARRACAAGDERAYASPGTSCRHYYRCDNGTAHDYACPHATWFDFQLQGCTNGAGVCYEPVCAGRTNGIYPDGSHDCYRSVECRGATVTTVKSCVDRCTNECPPPRQEAIPVPVGDARVCSDAFCSSMCEQVPDGAHADRSSGCREYFVCEAKRVIRRGVCEPGTLFGPKGCAPASSVRCSGPELSPCFNKANGLHRDWRECGAWLECRRERVVSRGRCDAGLVFDGAGCVPRTHFYCEEPRVAAECERRPAGTYQDLESNCTRYFHCEGSLRTTLSCGPDRVFDGKACVPRNSYVCPSLERETCYGRPDGKYKSAEGGCRVYYACVAGEKAQYACPPGQAFVGDTCVKATNDQCTLDPVCSNLAEGYYPEVESNCRKYFYCQGGDRVGTFSCLGDEMFDGGSCVPASRYKCGAPPAPISACPADGFYRKPGTHCKRYYMCLQGRKTELTCPPEQIFNGSLCVPKEIYTCPG